MAKRAPDREPGEPLRAQNEPIYRRRTPTKKYVKYEGGYEELFDLAADPHELNNAAEDPAYSADLSALRAMHDKLKVCAGDGCWVP